MATNKELATYILDQLRELEDVKMIPMMGGYLFYYRGKVFGGIYEPGFMVKITKASLEILAHGKQMPGYPGSKNLILVDDVDDREMLIHLVKSMEVELPAPKKKMKS